MARIRLRYVQEFVDRTGKVRRYFRHRGRRVTLPGLPGSSEFMAAYQEALATADLRPTTRESRAPARSIAALIDLVYDTHEYKALKPSSQRNERNLFERIRKQWGTRPADTLPADKLEKIIREIKTPGAANNMIRAWRKLMKLAVRERWRADNPCAALEKIDYRKKPHATWTEDDIAVFLDRYKSGSRERLAMALLLCTAQRRSDVVEMGRQHVRRGKIHVVQNKTGERLWIPIHAALQAELDRVPATQLTFLVTHDGKPFSAAGFGNWFREVCDGAGLEGLAAHGLRKAACRRLAEAGATAKEIMAISGHKTLSEVERYTAAADQVALAERAMSRIGWGTGTVKPG